MGNYLLLKEANKDKWCFALRFADGYRMIPVNDAFTYEVEERVKQPDCTPEEITAMDIKYLFLPFTIIKGVACDAVLGSVVEIHIKDKRYRFEIDDIAEGADGSAEEYITAFFDGVKRMPLPGRKQKVKADWREGKQKQSVLKYSKYIGWAVNIIGVIGWLFSGALHNVVPWLPTATLPLVGWLGAIVLCVALPEYYTPCDFGIRRRAGYTTYVTDLTAAFLIAPMTLLILLEKNFEVLNYAPVVAISILAALAFFALMYKLCRDLREHIEIAVVVLLLSVFGFMGITSYANHYANIGREAQPCTVTELQYRVYGGKNREKYYCTIKTQSGKTVELEVSKSFYHSHGEGDKVQAFVGKGALGIEYAYIEEN